MNPDEPKPEVKPTEPKPETSAPMPDPKAVELTHDAKAADSKPEPAAAKSEVKADEPEAKTPPKPETKVEPKTEVKPEPKSEAKAGSKPKVESETKPEAKAAAPSTAVGNKIIFTIAIIGILAGLVAAYIFGIQRKAQPPVFKPVSNPFESAIYANGMIESDLPDAKISTYFRRFPARSPRCWCRKDNRFWRAHPCL